MDVVLLLLLDTERCERRIKSQTCNTKCSVVGGLKVISSCFNVKMYPLLHFICNLHPADSVSNECMQIHALKGPYHAFFRLIFSLWNSFPLGF